MVILVIQIVNVYKMGQFSIHIFDITDTDYKFLTSAQVQF